MQQQKNLYIVAGVLVLFVILFAIKKSNRPTVAQVQPTVPMAAAPTTPQAPDEHLDPNFYIHQYNQSVENSSASQPGFFENVYDQVTSFLGVKKEAPAPQQASSAPAAANNNSADSGGKGNGGGGGGGSGGAANVPSSGGGSGGQVASGGGGGGGGGGSGGAPDKKDNKDGTQKDDSGGGGGSSGLVSNDTTPAPQDPIKAASEAAQNGFKTETHLALTLPDELTYRNLDLDEGIAGLSGYNTQLQVNISLLAKAGNYGPKDLPGFLQDYGAYIPGYNTSYTDRLSKDEPDRPSAQPNSGLNSPYVWSIQDGKNTVTVALVQRQDGQGTYLAVLSGPTSYFDSNEDRYDSIYSKIRATP